MKYSENGEFMYFFCLVKTDDILRLIKIELSKGIATKTMKQMKANEEGNFSQLPPNAIKIQIHAVFNLEKNITRIKVSKCIEDRYILVLLRDKEVTCFVKELIIPTKQLLAVNSFETAKNIKRITISDQFPFYIIMIDQNLTVPIC